MKRIFKTAVALATAAVLTVSPLAGLVVRAEAAPLAETRAFAEARLAELREAVPFAGLTLAIVDANNDFTWFHQVGYADVENGTEVTEYTLFNIASTSKIFTAIAAMQLVEDGHVDLDEPIATYLDGFSLRPHPVHGGNSAEITLRRLLTHTSGIHELIGDTAFTPNGQDRTFMNRLVPILSELHMQQEVNRFMVYNNTGLGIVGVLVGALSGNANYFDGFINTTQERIFAPAGMVHSSFAVNASNRPRVALPYLDMNTPLPAFTYMSNTAAGGMVSNAVDMARFLHLLLNGGGDVINAETLAYMLTPQNNHITYPVDVFNFGLGFGEIDRLDDGIVFWGHGGNLQHHAEFLFDMDAGIGVFAAVNCAAGNTIVHTLANQIMRVAYEEVTGRPRAATRSIQFSPPGIVDSSRIVGWYTGLAVSIIEIITNADGELEMVGLAGVTEPIILTPTGEGTFDATLLGELWFGDVNGTVFLFRGNNVLAEQVEVRRPSPEAAARFTGTWEIFEGAADLGLDGLMVDLGVNERGYLYMSLLGTSTIISSIDDYTSMMPGRTRQMGMVSEAVWDGEQYIVRESAARIRRAERSVLRLVIGTTNFTRNGEAAPLSTPSFAQGGRTWVYIEDAVAIFGLPAEAIAVLAVEMNGRPHIPLRDLAEALGGTVQWDGAHNAAYIVI